MSWEVRTMRSVTSCFKYTVFRKDLARCWPLWTVYLLLWVVFYPLLMLVDRGNSMRWSYAFDLERWTVGVPLDLAVSTGMVLLAMVVGLTAAMVAFSYLFNPRACQFSHALPVRREGLFLSHWLAGVTMFAGSHLILYGLTLLAQAACGGARPGPLAALLGLLTLMCLFFYSFAVLCAALTGHILAMPALYVIFNFLAAGLYFLVSWVTATFLFGLTAARMSDAVLAFTPVMGLDRWLDVSYPAERMVDGAYVSGPPQLDGAWVVWAYAGAGLVLSLIALLLYRRRQLELSGEVIAVGPLRPVFRYCFALCAALAGGCSLFVMFGLDGSVTFVFLMIIWGVVGYYIASMLLAKSFRVFRRWQGAVGVVLAVTALSGGMSLDPLGLETRVPDPADVAEVWVYDLASQPYDGMSYLNLDADDPEDIALIAAVHQAVVDHREELQRDEPFSYTYDAYHSRIYFEVNYTLKNGGVLRRSYSALPISADGLDDPGSVEAAIQALLDDRDFLRRAYGLDEAEGGRVVSLRVNGLYDEADVHQPLELWEEAYARETGVIEEAEASTQELAPVRVPGTESLAGTADAAALDAVLAAVESDFAAGTLGRRYLFDSQRDEADWSGVVLRLEWERGRLDETGRAYTQRGTVEIALSAAARDTLAALADAGALPRDAVLNDELGRTVWTGTGWADAG